MATNINQVMNTVLSRAFDPTKEDDFLSSTRYPRYGEPTYLKVIPVNLEDNSEIEDININLVSIVSTPLVAATDDYSTYLSIPQYSYDSTIIPKTYKALRKKLISFEANPIRIVQNIIDLNNSFDIEIEMLVKYTQDFKIKAGQLYSNYFDIINQNTEYDKHFYVYLSDDTVVSIGNQTAFNALQLQNMKATYNGGTSAHIELNKYFMQIAAPVAYDIVGTVVTYSSIKIPKNTTRFNFPVLRSNDIMEYNSALEIIDINTGQFNILNFKSEPIFSGNKYYDRLIMYANNKNISGSDILVKIENIKNILIPRGEVQGSYSYNLINTLPSVNNSSPVTSVASFDPYDYNSSIISMNQFPPAPEITPEEEVQFTGYIDNNVITDPNKLKLFTANADVFIDNLTTKLDYTINIAEYQSVVNIYEGVNLIGQGQLDRMGNFKTSLFGPLIDGPHTLYFKVQDAGGNESEPSPSITFTVDTINPVAPIISSYFLAGDNISTEIKSWETIPELYKFQMYGTTNNMYPYIVGFLEEQTKVNIYVNDVLTGILIPTFEQSLLNSDRTDTMFGFVYQIPGLNIGANTITYEMVDDSGNIGNRSQAAYIIYSPVNLLTPEIYLLDSLGHKIEISNSNIITEDQVLTIYGNGAKNKTNAEVYIVNTDTTETLIGKALVKKNSWSFQYNFGVGEKLLRFKVKSNDTGEVVIIDRTINIVGIKPTATITTEAITSPTNEPRYNKVTITFDKPIYGLTINDFIVNRCIFITDPKFGINPLQTTDNIVYEGVIYFPENYSNIFNDGYIQLRDDAVYDSNGIYNDTILKTGITNNIISLATESDFLIPFTPIIKLTIKDKRYGTRILNNNDLTDDNNPEISGLHIGAWFEDTIYSFPLTRSFRLPTDVNYNAEVINGSPFDKFISRIVEIQTPSGNTIDTAIDAINYQKAFCYLKKQSEYFDYLYFKDNTSFVFPEYNPSGELYYRTVQISNTNPMPGHAPVYSTSSSLIKSDHYSITPQVRDMLVNRFSGLLKNGEYNLTSNDTQDPLVTYQIITNDKSNYSRRGLIKVERFVIIFRDQNTVTFRMYNDNPIGLEAIPAKYYDENLTLDFNPQLEMIAQKAIFPNYETFEVITNLPSDYHIKYTKTRHTDTIIGDYKFELVNVGNVLVQAIEPVIIKLNLFYNDTIMAGQSDGKKFILPIKPYQLIDNSNLLYFSWLDFYVLSTKLEKREVNGVNKLVYSISRSRNGNSYKINFSTVKKIKFRPYDLLTGSANDNQYSYSLLNEYNLNYQDTAVCLSTEIINENGVPYSNLFRVNYNPENSNTDSPYIRIFPVMVDNPDLYAKLETVELTIKITFEMVLNGQSVEFSHDYIQSDYFTELDYFKINAITKLDGSAIHDINFIKIEYLPDNFYDSIRTNPYDLTTNKHTSTNEIEVLTTFDTFKSNVSTDPIAIYPRANNFIFKDNASFIDRVDFSKLKLAFESNATSYVSVTKEQPFVRDLAYYGLQDSCEVIYDGTKFIVKPIKAIYLNDINFTDEQDLPFINGSQFEAINTDGLIDSRLNKRPPSYIWIHLETNNGTVPSSINNMTYDEWLSVPNTLTVNPVGKYVPWIWHDTADGDFWINGNQLDSLRTKLGHPLPSTIKGSFRCNNNNLVNLDGGPSVQVYGNYIAKNNKLDSLVGLVPIIGGGANLYMEFLPDQFETATASSWTTQLQMFNDSDTDEWNNSFVENSRVGSSLDISFNPITLTTFVTASVCNIGWNIYIAGTSITYAALDIDTIRSKFNSAGLIYTYFDQTEYRYKLKDPVITLELANNTTSLINYVNPSNLFNRELEINDVGLNDTIRTKTGTFDLYSRVKLPLTNYVTNKTYHNTSEEII